jgi:hypothetical protein
MLNSDLMNRIACLKKVVDAMFQDDAPEIGQALNFCINLIFYKEEMKEINQTLSALDEIKDIKNIYSSLKDKKNAQ